MECAIRKSTLEKDCREAIKQYNKEVYQLPLSFL